jgi:hypothetical protein
LTSGKAKTTSSARPQSCVGGRNGPTRSLRSFRQTIQSKGSKERSPTSKRSWMTSELALKLRGFRCQERSDSPHLQGQALPSSSRTSTEATRRQNTMSQRSDQQTLCWASTRRQTASTLPDEAANSKKIRIWKEENADDGPQTDIATSVIPVPRGMTQLRKLGLNDKIQSSDQKLLHQE